MNAKDARILDIMEELGCDFDTGEQIFYEEITEKYGINDIDVAEMLFLLDAEAIEDITLEDGNKQLTEMDIEELSAHIKRKITFLLGGNKSKAFNNESIIKKAFVFIYDNLKVEFGLYDDCGKRKSCKELRRKELANVHEFVDCYELPGSLRKEVEQENENGGR